ncbi:flavin reductase family protein [Coralliovum pocilloporae]|uniref:flavin reductase family protein n=1 Tax=Coralliovum pocilloporae TaxID=3066369 RepID=UPI0033071778
MTIHVEPSGETVLRADFIKAMRRVISSVTVVTTDGPSGRFGATVSAFSSVSADPPMVLVCLHKEPSVARAVEQNGVFNVNILPETASAIANRFAGLDDDRVSDRFSGVSCSGQPPAIDHATVFICSVDRVLDAGSHLVVFGRVDGVRDASVDPLAYFDGAYRRVMPVEQAKEEQASDD